MNKTENAVIVSPDNQPSMLERIDARIARAIENARGHADPKIAETFADLEKKGVRTSLLTPEHVAAAVQLTSRAFRDEPLKKSCNFSDAELDALLHVLYLSNATNGDKLSTLLLREDEVVGAVIIAYPPEPGKEEPTLPENPAISYLFEALRQIDVVAHRQRAARGFPVSEREIEIFIGALDPSLHHTYLPGPNGEKNGSFIQTICEEIVPEAKRSGFEAIIAHANKTSAPLLKRMGGKEDAHVWYTTLGLPTPVFEAASYMTIDLREAIKTKTDDPGT